MEDWFLTKEALINIGLLQCTHRKWKAERRLKEELCLIGMERKELMRKMFKNIILPEDTKMCVTNFVKWIAFEIKFQLQILCILRQIEKYLEIFDGPNSNRTLVSAAFSSPKNRFLIRDKGILSFPFKPHLFVPSMGILPEKCGLKRT